MSDKQSTDTAKRMASSNLSVLQRNIMHGLDDERAESMFLRLCDHLPTLDAEQWAYRWRDLWQLNKWGIERAVAGYVEQGKATASEAVQDDLLNWLETRFYHRLVPGN